MYSLLTKESRKKELINKLTGVVQSNLKIVFCSSSLSMGMNLKGVDYVLHYGPPMTADAFLQETGRAAREIERHGYSILMTFPRMTNGRKIDDHMKAYVKAEQCLRDILLSKFKCNKPADQVICCQFCNPLDTCVISELIEQSFEVSLTDSFSDSDSMASVGEIEDLQEI